jgi:tRNA-splicing endonuclease subunit Sen2
MAPDDQFLLNYAAYHHFRSLGWVVRPGIKFGVDYLLYNRGPAFSHAEFAVLVIPAYTHRFWNTPGGRLRRRIQEEEGGAKDWWWLHAVNRVQSQVKKTLVLCYVDVPSPLEVDFDFVEGGEVDIGFLMRSYRVREFVVRRWVPNRTRD